MESAITFTPGKGLKVVTVVGVYTLVCLVCAAWLKLKLPNANMDIHIMEMNPTKWVFLTYLVGLTFMIYTINMRLLFWKETWTGLATSMLMLTAGTTGNLVESAISGAITNFIKAKIFDHILFYNINDVLIWCGSTLFLYFTAQFVARFIKWTYYNYKYINYLGALQN